MRALTSVALVAGAVVMVVGVIGTFAKISDNDGSLAIAGAVLVASGLIARAIHDQNAG